ncbi:hypothetical protein NDU88_001861 [Pleurodeles waltl]|uniref:Uncharacterized protein n=1 Tax=Pleurodeles waltl TaxID=8319 RepID=A0AAV7T194_PLEWA|nr:hypothetical protein NDU88_001861 [Pleurodeles waltl]
MWRLRAPVGSRAGGIPARANSRALPAEPNVGFLRHHAGPEASLAAAKSRVRLSEKRLVPGRRLLGQLLCSSPQHPPGGAPRNQQLPKTPRRLQSSPKSAGGDTVLGDGPPRFTPTGWSSRVLVRWSAATVRSRPQPGSWRI